MQIGIYDIIATLALAFVTSGALHAYGVRLSNPAHRNLILAVLLGGGAFWASTLELVHRVVA